MESNPHADGRHDLPMRSVKSPEAHISALSSCTLCSTEPAIAGLAGDREEGAVAVPSMGACWGQATCAPRTVANPETTPTHAMFRISQASAL